MARPIDADALIEHCKRIVSAAWNNKVAPISWSQAYQEFISELEDAPTIEAEPVRHGKWVFKKNEDYILEVLVCSNCGCSAYEDINGNDVYSNYCPDCGAKMDGGSR